MSQQIGQLMFLGLGGNQLGAPERAAIATYGVGSVWFTELSNASARSVAGVSAQVQGLAPSTTSGVGFLIAANQEGGQIDQFHGPGFDPIPSALQQGSEDPALLQTQAAMWGAELRAAGINLNLAPVMDTVPPGQDQANAPIGALQREFGNDPDTVSAHGVAFIAGMHQSHVLVTAKHFPGLGRVTANTDFTANAVDLTTTANDPYLAPFSRAIDAGVDLVMVSTATYTNIDPQHLAVFSPAIIGMLRGQDHFVGVVVSDDLGAAAAVASIPPGDRAVDFIAAGGDFVTVKTADLIAPMVTAISNRAANDRVFAGQIHAAVTRVLQVKVHAGLVTCATS
ncbi:MAG: glycoside hydrolase family 3 N-terminal domain-containing protein [Candidatus Dormibacteraceae bacterium]